jgi:ankyrin repeat protein
MNGVLAKTILSVGLFLVAGIGFYAFRGTAPREQNIPRIVRDLEHAITTPDIEELAIILRDRPDLVNLGMFGGPPLHIAAKHNQPLVIEYLLNHGADRDARGGSRGLARCSALHWACLWGSKDAAEKLIDQGFEIEDRSNVNNSTPLHWAAFGSGAKLASDRPGDYEGLVQLLIGRGAAVDTSNRRGVPAISVASVSVAKVLAANGAKHTARPSTRPSNDSMS